MHDPTSIELAFGARHGPPDPAGCLIMACFFGLWSAFMVAAALSPGLRSGFRWGRGGRGRPMSPVGCLGWAVATAAWAVALLGESMRYAPVTTRTGWILAGSFAVFMGTAIGDSIRHRRRERPHIR